MSIQKDEHGNIWYGGNTLSDIEKISDKENTYVWFENVPECSWETPHFKHKVTTKEFLDNHRNITSEIWILPNSRRWKWSDVIWAAIITGIFGVIGSFIQQCNKDSNAVPINNANPKTLPYHNQDWEWEDLDGNSGSKSVKIRVVYKIITDQFRWKFESHEYLDNGEKVKDALPKYLFTLPDFEKAIGIISVGMASEEGDDFKVETDRADRRAENILLALNPNQLAQNKNIYKLNLGQHKRTGGRSQDETSYQRKIVLIGVMSWSGEMPTSKMEECLKDALAKSQEISFSTESYPIFKLTSNKIDYSKIEIRE